MKINLKTKPPLDPLPDTRARRMVLIHDYRPGRFPGIVGNAGSYVNDGKFHESNKILNQI